MYETVKIVNGHRIVRMIGTVRSYYVILQEHPDLSSTGRKFAWFKTLKASVAYAENL